LMKGDFTADGSAPARLPGMLPIIVLNRAIAVIVSLVALGLGRLWRGAATMSSAKAAAASREHPPPWSATLLAASVSVAATVCQYEALRHLSFVSQTLGKSLKIVATMLVSSTLLGARFGAIDYACGLAVGVGCAAFWLRSSSSGAGVGAGAGLAVDAVVGAVVRAAEGVRRVLTNPADLVSLASALPALAVDAAAAVIAPGPRRGVALTALYLALDAGTAAVQRRTFDRARRAGRSVGAASYSLRFSLVSASLALAAALIRGELGPSVAFAQDRPEALLVAVGFATAASVGQLFIVATVRAHGPVTLSIAMTVRQALSVALSSFVYGPALGRRQAAAACVVFCALGVKARWGGKRWSAE